MRWPVVVLALGVALLMATGSAVAMVAPQPPGNPGTLVPSLLETDQVDVPASASVAPLAPWTPLSLTFTLNNPNAVALTEFLAEVENPNSPFYHHFLTYSQYLERFAPPESRLQTVEAALASEGLREIAPAPDRSSVNGLLPAGVAEQLLGVRLVTYGWLGSLPIYTAQGTVALPPSLTGLIDGVTGLSDAATAAFVSERPASAIQERPLSGSGTDFAHDNSTGENWYVGSDFTQAYGVTRLFPGSGSVPNATYPHSVAIATLLVSAYNQSSAGAANLPPWDPAVIGAYFNGTLGPGWPTSNYTGVPVTINEVTPPLPGSFGDLNDSTPYELENSLDLEMAGSLAPGASLYNFYFGASLLTGSVSDGDAANYFATDLEEALAYPYFPQHLAVVSCSFGIPDLTDPAWDAGLLTAAATGVTVVAASGDQGNAPDSLTGRSDGQWPIWPASDASLLDGALSVGGVSISLSGKPSAYYNGSALNLSYDPNAGGISSASAWYDTDGGPGAYAGTEGGLSTVYPEPSWQFHSAAEWPIYNATVVQGVSTLGRAEPDLAMPANETLATVSANATGAVFFLVLEGTSVAAPVLAGVLADIVAVDNNRSSGSWTSLGFIDPQLYRIGSYFWVNPGAPSDPFLDVISGKNYAFAAGPGWDPTTGWGQVEAAPFLLEALHNDTLLTYNYTGPTPGIPPSSSSPSGSIPWTIIFVIFGVGVVVALVLVFLAARPSRARPPPPTVPWGAQGGGATMGGAPGYPSAAPGATFLCPYCGAIRPAEPVRCPQCGAY